MASAFNLTAQLNIVGPNNLRPVINNLRQQLQGLNTNVNVGIDPNTSRNIRTVTADLVRLNGILSQTASVSQQVNANLNSITTSFNNAQRATNNATGGINNVNNALNNVNNNLPQATNAMEQFGRQSALAVRRFAAFASATSVIYGLTRAFTSAFDEFVKFDKEVIRLVQVTGQSAQSLKGLTNEISRLSISLGVSSSELIGVSSTLAQAGLTANQTKTALEALAKASLAPSFDDLSRTVEGSIAAMRQFNIGANQLESALGSINAVAAAFAVEAGDIIAAIQRTGGVFAAASNGVSQGTDALNEFVAVFTSVRQTTRESAETIATGLRTIFTRLQRGSTINFLKELGINLTDLEGKFVGPYKAVELLNRGLRNLDPRDLRYSQIVEELGGFRQIGKVIPLIQQFAVAQQALKVAQAGSASLTKNAAEAQLSLANQFTKVREEFLSFVRSLGESRTFRTLTSLALGLASSLISVANAFKPILPYLAILGTIRGTQAAMSFGRGFMGSFGGGGGGGGAGTGGGNAPNPNTPNTGGGRNQNQQNVLNNASVVANTTAINNQTTSLASNTTSINNLITSIQNMNRAFVNAVNALGRAINTINTNRGSFNSGGRVYGFSKGGSVPGSGSGDTVSAMLEPGEFVVKKQAAKQLGSRNLERLNKYDAGGKVTTKASRLKSRYAASIGVYELVKDGSKKEHQAGEAVNPGDSFSFNRKIYGYDRPDLVDDPQKFEVAVAKRTKGNLATNKDPNFPVDVTNSRFGPLEVRNRKVSTSANTLLDKFIRYYIANNNTKKLSNKINPGDDISLGDLGVVYNTAKYKPSNYVRLQGGGIASLAQQKGQSLTDTILEQIGALGGIKGVKQLVGSSAGDRTLDALLRASNIKANRNIEQVTSVIDKALTRSGTTNAAERNRIAKLKKVGVAGLLPLGYNKNFEWDIGNNRSVDASVKGFPSRYKDTILQMQQESSEMATRFAENLQYSEIFGGAEKLAFDFDETLVSGADILNAQGQPDIPQYSNRDVVSKALRQGRLTRLGTKLKSLIDNDPNFIKQTRILTARPQSTADLLASALQRFGLPYQTSDITGISRGLGTDVALGKATNLSETEKLIDDSLANVTATRNLGKKAFLYSEPGSTGSEFNEKFGQGNIEGAIVEKALAQLLGYSLDLDKLESNRAIDFPQGLGRAAQFFDLDPNIPTEVKRTLNSDSFERARSEFDRYFQENPQAYKFGGLVMGKGRGKKGAKGARDVIEPISSEQYLKWAKSIYADYDNDPSLVMTKDELGIRMPPEIALANKLLTQYALETGGAGLKVGRRFVATPGKYIDDALKPYLVSNPDNPNELGFYEDVVAKFGRSKKISAAATKKLGKEEAFQAAQARLGTYADAENAIAEFKKSGVLNISSSIMDYITSSINNLDGLPLDSDEIEGLRKKLTKTNLDAFNALVGPNKTPVSVQGQRTKLGEVLNSILETYGSNVSSLEVDNITRAMGQKLNRGGFAEGGVVPALLTPGEAVISPDMAQKIGYGQLRRMNNADRFSGGGDVSIVPGVGNTDTYGPVPLPEGSFVIRKKATEALGFNSGGRVRRFNNGGSASNPQQAYYAAQQTQRTTSILEKINPRLAENLQRFNENLGGTVASLGLAATTLSSQLPKLYANLDKYAGTALLKSATAAGAAGALQQGGANIFAAQNIAEQAGFGTTGKLATVIASGVGGAVSGYLRSRQEKEAENIISAIKDGDKKLEEIFNRLQSDDTLSAEQRAALDEQMFREIGNQYAAIGTPLENATETWESTLARAGDALSGFVLTFAAIKTATRRSNGGVVYAKDGTLVNYEPKGTDTIPAMLSKGEFVVNARSTRKNLGLLNAINKNKGGIISPNYLAVGGLSDYGRNFRQFYMGDYSEGLEGGGGSGDITGTLLRIGGRLSAVVAGLITAKLAGVGGVISTIGNLGRSAITRVAGGRGIAGAGTAATQAVSGGTTGRLGNLGSIANIGSLALAGGQSIFSLLTGGGTTAEQEARAAEGAERFRSTIPRAAEVLAGRTSTETLLKRRQLSESFKEGSREQTEALSNEGNLLVRARQIAELSSDRAKQLGLESGKLDEYVKVAAQAKNIDPAQRTKEQNDALKAEELISQARTNLYIEAFNANSSLSQDQRNVLVKQAKEAQTALEQGKNLTEEQKSAYESVIVRGKELVVASDRQVQANELLKRTIVEVTASTKNFADAISTIQAGIEKASVSFERSLQKLDMRVGSRLTGRSEFGAIDRTNESVFSNLRAYTKDEILKATAGLSATFGFDKIVTGTRTTQAGQQVPTYLSDTLREASLATRTLEVELPKILRQNTNIQQAQNFIPQINQALQAGGLSASVASELSRQIGNKIEQAQSNRVDKGGGLAAIADDIPGFLQTIESLNNANKLQTNIAKALNDSLEKLDQQSQKAADALVRAAEIQSEIARTSADFNLRLRQSLGYNTSLGDQNAPFNAEIERLSTVVDENGRILQQGTTDPNVLGQRIKQGEANKLRLEQERQKAIAAGDNEKQKQLTHSIRLQVQAINQSQKALERLASDSSRASNALSKIEERRSTLENRRSGIFGIIANMNNPDYLMNIMQQADAVQRFEQNRATDEDLSLIAQNIDSIVAARGGEEGKAFQARFIDTIEQRFGQNVGGLFRGIARPEEDPTIKTMRDAAIAYTNIQMQAQEELSNLQTDAANVLIDGLPDSAKEFRDIIVQAAIEAGVALNQNNRNANQPQAQVQANMAQIGVGMANINVAAQQQPAGVIPPIQPVNPANKANGGIIYASSGSLINFEPKGTDTVPAMLTPGEFVVNARATAKNLPLLKAINDGAKGYSSGGVAYLVDGGKPDERDKGGRFGVEQGVPVDANNPMTMNAPLNREQILAQRRQQYEDMKRARREAYEATPQGARIKQNREDNAAKKEARIQKTAEDLEKALAEGELQQAGVTDGGTPLYSVKLPDSTYSSAKTAESALAALRKQKDQQTRDSQLRVNLPGAVPVEPVAADDVLKGGPLAKPLTDEQRSQLELLDRGRKIAAQAGWDINQHNLSSTDQTWGHSKPLSEEESRAFDAYKDYEIKKYTAQQAKAKEEKKQKAIDDLKAEMEAKRQASSERIRKEVDAASATRQEQTKAKAEAQARRKEEIEKKYNTIPPNASLTVAEIIRSYGSKENKEAMLDEKISNGPPLDPAIIESLTQIHLQKKAERESRVASRKKEQEDVNSARTALTNRRSAIISKLQDTISQLNREEEQAVADRDKGMAGLGNLLNTAITGDQTYNNRIKYIKQKRSILQPQLDRLASGFRAKGWFDDDTKATDIQLLEEAENIYNGIVVGMRGAEIANTKEEIGSQMQTLDTTEKTLEYTRNAAEMVAGMGVGSLAGAGRTATTLGGKIAVGAASAAGEEAALASTTNAIEVATGQKTLTEAATDVGVRTLGAGVFGGVGGAIGAGVAKAAAARAGKELEENIVRQEAAEIAEATRQRIASQEFKPTVRSYEAGFSREGYSPMQLAMMDNAPSPMKDKGYLYEDLGGNARVAPFPVQTPESRTDASIAKFLMAENAAENIAPPASAAIPTPTKPVGAITPPVQAPVSEVTASASTRKSLVEMAGGEEAFNTPAVVAASKAEEAATASQRGRPKTRYGTNPTTTPSTNDLSTEAVRARMSGVTPNTSPTPQKAVMETLQQKPSATVADISAAQSVDPAEGFANLVRGRRESLAKRGLAADVLDAMDDAEVLNATEMFTQISRQGQKGFRSPREQAMQRWISQKNKESLRAMQKAEYEGMSPTGRHLLSRENVGQTRRTLIGRQPQQNVSMRPFTEQEQAAIDRAMEISRKQTLDTASNASEQEINDLVNMYSRNTEGLTNPDWVRESILEKLNGGQTVDDIRAQLSSQARSSSSSAKEKAVLESMSTNKPSTAQNVSASVQSSAIDDLAGPLPSVSDPTMDEASRLQEIDAEILSLRSKERKGWFGSGLGRINNEESIATLTSEARKIREDIDIRNLMARGSHNLEIERAGPGASFYEGDEWKRFVEGGIPNEFRTYGTVKPNYTEEGMAFARLRDAQMNSRGMKGRGDSGNYSGFENAMFDPFFGYKLPINREYDKQLDNIKRSISRSGGIGYTTDPTGGIRIIGNDTIGRPGAELYNIPADSVTPELLENINRLNIQKFNRGGLVYASNGMLIPYSPRGSDTVPAMLTPGEFVVNRKAAQQNLGLLKSINSGSAQYLNRGGVVQYLKDGAEVGGGGGGGYSIDFSEFSNAVSTFGAYVSSINDSFGQISNLDFGVFKTSVDSLISSFNALNGPANLFNNAAIAFGTNITAITTAINALANIPNTINIAGRIDMPTNITVSLEGNTGDTSVQLKKDILNAVANALSQSNPGINVDKLREQP